MANLNFKNTEAKDTKTTEPKRYQKVYINVNIHSCFYVCEYVYNKIEMYIRKCTTYILIRVLY